MYYILAYHCLYKLNFLLYHISAGGSKAGAGPGGGSGGLSGRASAAAASSAAATASLTIFHLRQATVDGAAPVIVKATVVVVWIIRCG